MGGGTAGSCLLRSWLLPSFIRCSSSCRLAPGPFSLTHFILCGYRLLILYVNRPLVQFMCADVYICVTADLSSS